MESYFIRSDTGEAFRYSQDFEDDYSQLEVSALKREGQRLISCGSWSLEHVFRCRCLDSLILKAVKDEEGRKRIEANQVMLESSNVIRDSMFQNIRFMHEVNGIRALSEGEYSGLRRTLRGMMEEDDKCIKLVNEIVFYVRFGWLAKKRDGSEISVSDSIQSAINFYKRGSWRSPLSHEILNAVKGIL